MCKAVHTYYVLPRASGRSTIPEQHVHLDSVPGAPRQAEASQDRFIFTAAQSTPEVNDARCSLVRVGVPLSPHVPPPNTLTQKVGVFLLTVKGELCALLKLYRVWS